MPKENCAFMFAMTEVRCPQPPRAGDVVSFLVLTIYLNSIDILLDLADAPSENSVISSSSSTN